MSFKDEMHEAIAQYLRDVRNVDAVQVLSVVEEEKSDGYCETCWYEYTECDITYVDSDGTQLVYAWSGSLSELINYIT